MINKNSADTNVFDKNPPADAYVYLNTLSTDNPALANSVDNFFKSTSLPEQRYLKTENIKTALNWLKAMADRELSKEQKFCQAMGVELNDGILDKVSIDNINKAILNEEVYKQKIEELKKLIADENNKKVTREYHLAGNINSASALFKKSTSSTGKRNSDKDQSHLMQIREQIMNKIKKSGVQLTDNQTIILTGIIQTYQDDQTFNFLQYDLKTTDAVIERLKSIAIMLDDRKYGSKKYKQELDKYEEALNKAQKTLPTKPLVSIKFSTGEALEIGEMIEAVIYRRLGVAHVGKRNARTDMMFTQLPIEYSEISKNYDAKIASNVTRKTTEGVADAAYSMLEELEGKLKKANSTQLGFKIHVSAKDYTTIYNVGVKSYGQFKGFKGGSAIHLLRFMELIQHYTSTAPNNFLDDNDIRTLYIFLLNSSEETLGSGELEPLRKFLSIFAIGLLFDEGANMLREALDANPFQLINTLHVFMLDTIYVTSSYIMGQLYEQLTKYFQNAQNAASEYVDVEIQHRKIKKYTSGMFKNDAWEELRKQQEKDVMVQIIFLKNFIDIIRQLNLS